MKRFIFFCVLLLCSLNSVNAGLVLSGDTQCVQGGDTGIRASDRRFDFSVDCSFVFEDSIRDQALDQNLTLDSSQPFDLYLGISLYQELYVKSYNRITDSSRASFSNMVAEISMEAPDGSVFNQSVGGRSFSFDMVQPGGSYVRHETLLFDDKMGFEISGDEDFVDSIMDLKGLQMDFSFSGIGYFSAPFGSNYATLRTLPTIDSSNLGSGLSTSPLPDPPPVTEVPEPEMFYLFLGLVGMMLWKRKYA